MFLFQAWLYRALRYVWNISSVCFCVGV